MVSIWKSCESIIFILEWRISSVTLFFHTACIGLRVNYPNELKDSSALAVLNSFDMGPYY